MRSLRASGIWSILTMSSGPATRRLLTELRELQSETESPPFLVDVDEDDILTWCVILNGPPDSPYAGSHFEVY